MGSKLLLQLTLVCWHRGCINFWQGDAYMVVFLDELYVVYLESLRILMGQAQ